LTEETATSTAGQRVADVNNCWRFMAHTDAHIPTLVHIHGNILATIFIFAQVEALMLDYD